MGIVTCVPHVTHSKRIPSWAANFSKVKSYECIVFVKVYFSGVCVIFIRGLVKKYGGRRGEEKVAYRSSGFL